MLHREHTDDGHDGGTTSTRRPSAPATARLDAFEAGTEREIGVPSGPPDAAMDTMVAAMGSRSDETASPVTTTRTSSPERSPSGDRKSVVSGKSVSVRVDIGGRRLIKKK